MTKHLAIISKPVAEAILNGRKTIETRFSLHKIAPFGQVNIGDLVYIKPPGEEIIGQFTVKKVFSYEGLTPEDVDRIIKDYGDHISSGDSVFDEEYYHNKKNSRYGTLIFIDQSERFITSPVKIKKSDQRGWMVLK